MAFNLARLDELSVSLIDGDRGKNYPKQADFKDSGYCLFLSAKNVTRNGFKFEETAFISQERDELLRAGKLQRNDIIITTRGTIGNVAFYAPDVKYPHVRINSGMIIVRVDESVWNPKFLYFVLTSPFINQQTEALTSGSAVPQLPARDLKTFLLPIVPKPIQDNISQHISKITDKIHLNQKLNQTLEQMAQALFKSWFVDFDPVIDNALAAGKAIPAALQYKADLRKQAQQLPDFNPLPEDIRQLFPSEFEQTGEPTIGIKGWIPKGWRVSNTDNEFVIKGGSTPSTKTPDFWDGGDIHWTSPKDLSGNDSKILLDTNRKITDVGLAKITSGLLPVDTVLMSSRAPVGYLALAKVPLAINQGYIALQCAKDLTSEYTIQFLDSIMDEIKGISGGTTFAEISKKTFKSIKLIVPSKSAIDAFTSIAKVNYDKITENVKQTNSLAEIRDYLLPKLISGEITLEDISHE